MALCPAGAISILGVQSQELQPLAGHFPEPEALETLIRGRRSVRKFKEENLDPELLTHLLEVAWQAPTGKNHRQVLLTVIDDRKKMAEFRERVIDGLSRLAAENALPAEHGYFAGIARKWKEKKVDILFRNAPHLLIATAPSSVATPVQDCLIALSTFDLFAQANGVGTLWDGFATWAIDRILPELKPELGIPADHVFGYAVIFGKPAVHYARTVLHRNPMIHRIK
jgi:nitroreductase